MQQTVSPVSWLSGHDILRSLGVFQGWIPWREMCAVQAGSCSQASGLVQAFPLSPERRTGMQHWEVLSSQSVTGPGGWGGNSSLGDHTQLPIHSGQRLYILNSCCLCLAFTSAALTQLPETSLQGTTVPLAFRSYLTCTPSPPPSYHTHAMPSFHF